MTRILASILLTCCLAPLARAQDANTNSAPAAVASPRWNEALSAVHTNWIASPGHVLTPGDVVDVKVYQEEELNTRARVESDGTISMPILGLVKVGGQTVEQAQKLIRDLLFKDYLQNPQVTLAVADSAKKRFCILGEVRQPGFYSIPDNETMTVLQAISLAGGYTAYAQPGRTTIKRVTDGVPTVFSIDAKSMARKRDVPIIEIKANDTIVVNAKIF